MACLAALTADGLLVAAQSPRELPVIVLDDLPGAVALLPLTPQRSAPLPSLPVTRLDERGAAPFDEPRALSLTFARPVSIRDVVLLLFRGTPFSVTLDPAVSGMVDRLGPFLNP